MSSWTPCAIDLCTPWRFFLRTFVCPPPAYVQVPFALPRAPAIWPTRSSTRGAGQGFAGEGGGHVVEGQPPRAASPARPWPSIIAGCCHVAVKPTISFAAQSSKCLKLLEPTGGLEPPTC